MAPGGRPPGAGYGACPGGLLAMITVAGGWITWNPPLPVVVRVPPVPLTMGWGPLSLISSTQVGNQPANAISSKHRMLFLQVLIEPPSFT